MGCGCLSAGFHACTTAPITDRRQLKLIPESKLNAQAAQLFEQVKQKAKLSDDKETLDKIISIGSRIETSISEYFDKNNMDDPTINFSWEYILIDNKKIKNAWCMPGGKIAVYTGMLDIPKGAPQEVCVGHPKGSGDEFLTFLKFSLVVPRHIAHAMRSPLVVQP